MSKKVNYTKEQKHLIKQLLVDADIMGLNREESMAYVRGRLGPDFLFSLSSYKKFKCLVFNENVNVQWITYYARQGFVEFYRKRISEMEMIQKETLKEWLIETSKPEAQKDKRLIISLVAELRANNQQLSSLGMVTPIIATIKNLIDKKEGNNNSNSIEDARRIYPIQYQARREDIDPSLGKNDDGTTTTAATGGNDDAVSDVVPRDVDDGEEAC